MVALEFNDLFGCEEDMLGIKSKAANISAEAAGDVHFYGFNGQSFDFNGVPDKFYCLISDNYIQINALFRGWNKTNETSMKRIGVKIGNQKCGFTYLEIDQDGVCEMNNTEFKEKSYFPLGVQDFQGEVKLTNEFEGYDPTLPGLVERAGTFEGLCMEITAGVYNLKLIRSSEPVSYEDESPYFVNLVTSISKKDICPHGIIGQTVRPLEDGTWEGAPEDYEVSSLFANDFKFNRFNLD